MLIKGHQIKAPKILVLNLVLVLICFSASSVNGVEPRKLDESTPLVPAKNGTEEKCGSCGSGTTYPSPPPPALPPPSPPPPSPKKPPSSSEYCPPPPPSSFIYITGPPGNLYPVDEDFSGATSHHRHGTMLLLPLFVGLLSTLAFW